MGDLSGEEVLSNALLLYFKIARFLEISFQRLQHKKVPFSKTPLQAINNWSIIGLTFLKICFPCFIKGSWQCFFGILDSKYIIDNI